VGKLRPPPKAEFIAIGLGWTVALAMESPALFFLNCAHVASAAQGVSHRWTGEVATMPRLASHADELAHTTFFPRLLVDAVVTCIGRRVPHELHPHRR
jgi:hypothetical protein